MCCESYLNIIQELANACTALAYHGCVRSFVKTLWNQYGPKQTSDRRGQVTYFEPGHRLRRHIFYNNFKRLFS